MRHLINGLSAALVVVANQALSLSTPSGVSSTDAVTNGQRAWSGLDQFTVEGLMKVKGSIVVDLGRNHFVWPIGRTDMTDVFVKMEDCVWKNQGR